MKKSIKEMIEESRQRVIFLMVEYCKPLSDDEYAKYCYERRHTLVDMNIDIASLTGRPVSYEIPTEAEMREYKEQIFREAKQKAAQYRIDNKLWDITDN